MQKLNHIDLFCGAGGLSEGFRQAGFNTLWANDFEGPFCESFKRNHPETIVMPGDIREITAKSIQKDVSNHRIDVVAGGPPCQGFSVAGKRQNDDSRNQLVWEFYRIVDGIRPQAFVMENVPGLLLAKHRTGEKLTDVLIERFTSIGYTVAVWRLNSRDYGVPQSRKRAFLVGVLGGKLIEPPKPVTGPKDDLFTKIAPFVTVADALSDLPEPTSSEPQPYNGPSETDFQMYLRRGSKVLYNHTPSIHKPQMVKRLRLQHPGTRLYSNWNHSWYKLKLDEPSPTVKENHRAPFVHPTSPRVTTPRECARLQSYPDKYIFLGTKSSQLMQIGNAVPPLLARAIAQKIARALA